jgi:hypothetical protein
MTEPKWSALSGLFTARYDEALTELGRSIYHGKEIPSDSLPSESPSVVVRYLFGVLANPWRLAFVNLLIDNDDTHPAFASTDESVRDDWQVQALLDPSPLTEVVDLPEAGTFRIPGPSVEADLALVPALVVLSSDYYEAEMNQDLGILTSWRAFIRGRLAVEFTVQPGWWER